MNIVYIFLIFIPFASGQVGSDGQLQCQCTCTPVGVPNKTIYTSGNMNVVNSKTNEDINNSPSIDISKNQKPAVEGTPFPINKTFTQFNDVAVSKVRHSLEFADHGKVPIIKNEPTPKIKWIHTPRPANEMKDQIQQQSLQNGPKDIASGGLVNSGSLSNAGSTANSEVAENTGNMMMRNNDMSINEININKPVVTKTMLTLKDIPQDIIQNPTETKIDVSHTDTSNMMSSPGLDNQQPDVIKDQIQPIITNKQTTFLTDQSAQPYMSKGNDHVAADIGFVLDGSAPSPILSSVMSGVRGTIGTGYIVENIGTNSQRSQNKAHFVETTAKTPHDGSLSSVPSLVQQGNVAVVSPQTTETTNVNNHLQQTGNRFTNNNNNQQPNSNVNKNQNNNNNNRSNMNSNNNEGNQNNNRNNQNNNRGNNNNNNQNNNNNNSNNRSNMNSNNNEGNQNNNRNNQNNNRGNNNNINRNNSGRSNNRNNNSNNHNRNNNSNNNNNNNNRNNNNSGSSNNNNRGNQNNNNKSNQNNRSKWNNKGNDWNKNNGQNKQNNKKPWQSNNQQQNNGNRNTWDKELKPFQISHDTKTGFWNNNNNNNNWGNNNWGTTASPDPPMSFGMMDPLLFLGQHHLK